MKLTYSSLACPEWTVEEAVAAATHYGYQAIEWRLADGETIEPDASAQVRRRLREVPRAQGIEIACLDTSCRVTQGSLEARMAVVEAGERMIDMAAELGAPYIRVFGGPLPPGATCTAMLGPTAEVLYMLGIYSSARNVTVMLETHDSWTRSEDVRELIQAVNLPTVKVLWDTHHTYRSGEPPAQTLALLGDAIAYVHLKDSYLTNGKPGAWTYSLLGEGDVPLYEICSTLKSAGYDGYISLEWEKKWHPEITGPEVALPQAVPYIHRFWQQV